MSRRNRLGSSAARRRKRQRDKHTPYRAFAAVWFTAVSEFGERMSKRLNMAVAQLPPHELRFYTTDELRSRGVERQ